jgi:Ser/Thr protein kinase RdoA (MazF antagonist)
VDAVPAELEAEAAIAAAWGVGAIRAAALPDAGTVNRTVLLTTARGRFALRGYRHRDRGPVDREHALIAYAAARGVPAVAPLPLPGGGTVLERGGRCFALFPWAVGRQVARADVGAAEAAAMGAALGRLHLALRGFPPAGLPRRPAPSRSSRWPTAGRGYGRRARPAAASTLDRTLLSGIPWARPLVSIPPAVRPWQLSEGHPHRDG